MNEKLMMPKGLLAAFKKHGEQFGVHDPVVSARYFLPGAEWTWYAVSYNPETRIFWGYVEGTSGECGCFSLDDLLQIRGRGIWRVERELYFDACCISEIPESRFYFGNPLKVEEAL